MELVRRLLRRMTPVSDWALWSLPRGLKAFVLAVVAAYVVATGSAAPFTSFRKHDLILFGVLLTCTAVAVELSRRAKERSGWDKDVQGVWEFPIIILLPPLFALIAPISRLALTQWRVSRPPLHRRVFSLSSIGLSYGAASLAFHGMSRALTGMTGLSYELVWTLLVTLSAVLQAVVNKTIIMTAIKGSNPTAQIRPRVFGREPLYNDSAEICISILLTYAVSGNLFLAPAALPVVTLLQRSLRHAQLLTDSRADSKTGLLNAATWERESAAEVTRAVRTRSPLAVALLDIDRF